MYQHQQKRKLSHIHECQKVEEKVLLDISLFLTTPENQDNFLEMMILHDLDPYINLPSAFYFIYYMYMSL